MFFKMPVQFLDARARYLKDDFFKGIKQELFIATMERSQICIVTSVSVCFQTLGLTTIIEPGQNMSLRLVAKGLS